MDKAKQVFEEGVPILLDGTPDVAQGNGEKGNFYTKFQNYLEKKYPEFLPYLSIDELAIYDEEHVYYKHETFRDRAMKANAYCDVVDKIPEAALNSYYTRIRDEYKVKMNKLIAAKNKHVNYELGAKEFTLTYSPKWFSDEEARKQMTRAINRLCYYYRHGDQRIIKLRAVGEVGTNGLSHVHCFYQLLGGIKITDKNFKRAYPPWDTKVKQGPSGHKGGHHANVRHHADFLGYIEKEVTGAWLDITVGGDDPVPV